MRLGRGGPASLRAQVHFNAKDFVLTALAGGGEGRISIGAFVAEVLNLGELRLGERVLPEFVEVPLRTTEFQLADNMHESAQTFDFESRAIGVDFTGAAGSIFACSVFVEAFATTTGLCWADVDFAGIVDPIDICQ